MELAIFNLEGFVFLLRWFHFFFGVIWIGLLYYFNFVQGPFFTETDAGTKSNATQKLVPRALWWFRWGAFYTMLTGLLILAARGHQTHGAIYSSVWGALILTGTALGLVMGSNVWFVIWPNQKVVIQNATQLASGGSALPNAAASAAKAGLASRHNVMFSIPMLFFMGAATHLPIGTTETPNFQLFAILTALVIAALEFNALKGKLGPLTSVRGVITCGFALTALLYVMLEICL